MKCHKITGSGFMRTTGLMVLACCAPSALVQAQDNPCGQSTEADIVMMIDLTGSISNGALTLEKNGVKTLLDFFAGADPKPRVAIGTFNGPCSKPNQGGCPGADDRARILADLTATNVLTVQTAEGAIYTSLIFAPYSSKAICRPRGRATNRVCA